jgi:hypothetical protein
LSSDGSRGRPPPTFSRPPRSAPGAKADIVLVDLDAPTMQPLRDPLRSLIFAAAERAVRDVYVDGKQVVRDGEVVTLDLAAALARLETLRGKAEEEVPAKHWSGRPGHEVAPLALPLASDG